MTDISFEELIKLKKASNDLVSALTSDAENLEEGALDIGRIAGRFLAASSTLGLCGKGPDNGPDSLKKWDQLAHQTSELAGWLSLLRSDRFPPSFQPYVIQNHIRPKALEISRILKYEGFVETDENYAKTNTRPNQS